VSVFGANRPIDAIADDYVEDYCALSPITATHLGVWGHEDRLNDLSPDGYAAREELARKALSDASGGLAGDERERVAKDAFLERLGLDVEMYDALLPQSEVSVIASALHDMRQVFDLMDSEGEAAQVAIDARLAAVPETLHGYRQTLLRSADLGRVAAKRQLLEVAAQVRGWTGRAPRDNFFLSLADGLNADADGALGAQLHQHARGASRAFADFGSFLQTELAARGRDVEAVGAELYSLCSRYFLGARLDLEETYHWGWDELGRISAEMDTTAHRIVPGGSVDEAVAGLDADPSRRISGKESFRGWMQALADRTLVALADVHFDIAQPVRRIECCLAPTSDGGIYYTGPSEDFSRPGRMWWAVPEGIDEFSTWREVTTVFHEGVPGHHLQVGQTAFQKDQLNRWQRLMCWVAGHGEGWALYAERLMDELGHLHDPGDKLGMLDAQAFRAARVILDIGLHLQLRIPRDNPFGFHPGERWTPALGFEFLRQQTRMDDPTIVFEVNRYLGWPGQAPAYKVGERTWFEARRSARERLGASFDLKEFHRAALDLGSMGLDPFRAAMSRLG